MKMYQLTDQWAELYAMLDDCENDEQAIEILTQINETAENINDKAENYAYIYKNMKAEASVLRAKSAILKEEAARLDCKARAKENRAKRLMDHLFFAMELGGIRCLPTSIGKFYIQKMHSVEVLDETKIPEEFTLPQPAKISKAMIIAHWNETGEIPDGCDIIQSEGVRFR